MKVRVTLEIAVFEPDGAAEAVLNDLARSAAEALVRHQSPGTKLVEVSREQRFFTSIDRPEPAVDPESPPF